MFDLLQGSRSYTGPSAQWGNMPVAGKTGTTTDSKDLWFSGVTPYYSGSVWLGYYDSSTSLNQLGLNSNAAAAVWGKIMSKVHEGLEVKNIEQPDGIIRSEVCIDSASQYGFKTNSNSEYRYEKVPTKACRDDNNNCIGLNYVGDAYYNDSSFNMKVELKANTTYYFVDYTYSSRQPGDICLYLTDPSNYEMDLSESGENVVTCDMEILKAGEVTVTVPESGFYELGANGGEELYEISSPGMDSGLALYKDQTKVAYFSTPGTYIVRVSRELMPGDYMGEGSSAEEYMDQLTFSMRKTSSVESLSVYDGTKNTEKEVTLREAGDYAWYSFTPGKDAGYTLLTNWYEEDYGYFDKYVYELKEDCLEQIYYSNGMYELEVGKTYYVKILII